MKLRSTTALTALALMALTACGSTDNSSTADSSTAENTASSSATASSVVMGESASASTSEAATPVPSASTADPSTACGQPASSATTIEGTLAVDSWVTRGNGEYPTSQKYGGLETGANGAPVCFSHSPEGAVLAMATIWGSPYDSDALHASFKDRVFPTSIASDMADIYFNSLTNAAGDQSSALSDAKTQTVAYKLDSYTGDTAVVEIAESINGKDSGYLKLKFTMQWVDNDWYLDMTQLGDASDAVARIDNLDGLTSFNR